MATLNLFQIVSKQLKEATFVSLEDTHKQLDMVRGAQVPGRQAGSSRDGSSRVDERHDGYRAVVLKFSELPGNSGLLLNPAPECWTR